MPRSVKLDPAEILVAPTPKMGLDTGPFIKVSGFHGAGANEIHDAIDASLGKITYKTVIPGDKITPMLKKLADDLRKDKRFQVSTSPSIFQDEPEMEEWIEVTIRWVPQAESAPPKSVPRLPRRRYNPNDYTMLANAIMHGGDPKKVIEGAEHPADIWKRLPKDRRYSVLVDLGLSSPGDGSRREWGGLYTLYGAGVMQRLMSVDWKKYEAAERVLCKKCGTDIDPKLNPSGYCEPCLQDMQGE